MGNKPLRLGDCFAMQRGTTYKSKLLGLPGPVLLGLASICRNGGFRKDSLKTYGGECPEKLMVYPGDLFLSLKDVTQSADLLGAVARLPMNHKPGRLTQDTVKLISIQSELPQHYLYWLLQTPQYRDYCRQHSTGTTNLGLSRDDFFAFPVPDLTTSILSICDCLDALEQKATLLRSMNETLEAMARSLFKSWFIDFDPVRKKAEGQPTGLPPEIDALFPDSFVDSELGEIPKGWIVSTLGEVLEIAGGSTPSTKELSYWDGNYWFATPKDLSSAISPILSETERKITQDGVNQITSGQLPAGTLLLSSRAPIGYLAITAVPVSINQGFIAMKKESKLSPYYMYSWCKEYMETIIGHANGTTFLEISKSNYKTIKAIVPPRGAIDKYTECAKAYFDLIEGNTGELSYLASARDSLLPQLISGDCELADTMIHIILEKSL